MIDDSELLRRYAEEGDQAAFTEFVQRRVQLVYAVAKRKLGDDGHLAEDVVQRVFDDLARKASTLCRHPVPSAWLFTSTHYAALQLARAERRRRAREEKAMTMKELPDDGTDPAALAELRPVLDDLVNALGARDREAVLLRFFEERTWPDIGARLRLSEDGARSRVERALEKLRGMLARRGIASTSAALGSALAGQTALAAPPGLAVHVASTVFATTPATATPAVGFISFMSTSKIVLSSAALLVVLGLGGALYEINARHSAEHTLAALQNENRLLAARVQTRRAEAGAAARQQALDAARAAPPTDARTAAQARQDAAKAAGEAFLIRHPEVRTALIEMWRNQAGARYAPLLRSLKLTPEQIEQFKDLTFGAGATAIGLQKGQDLSFVDRPEQEVELQALLGEEGFQRYKSAKAGNIGYDQVLQLASALYRSEMPITAAQGEALHGILAASQRRVDWALVPQYDWDAIMREARSVLSASQLAELGHLEAHDSMRQAETRIRRAGANTLPSPAAK